MIQVRLSFIIYGRRGNKSWSDISIVSSLNIKENFVRNNSSKCTCKFMIYAGVYR